jgi:glycosyltransferase involved in cell wall biosynthesis
MTGPIRILELRSVSGTGGGPEKTILLGAARTDPNRFAVTVCYLRDARDTAFSVDAKAAALPIDYVEVVERHSFHPSIWFELRRLVQQRRIDIIHAHDYKTDLIAWGLARVGSAEAMSTVHGWTGNSRRERWLYYPGDKQILCSFPKLIAVSHDIRRELVRHGARPERVAVIPNGIDHLAFRRDQSRERSVRDALGIAGQAVVIGAVGRLARQKRFDLLLDAVAALRPAHPELLLLVAGDGSLREPLEAQAKRLDLLDSCRFLGQRTDVAELHHAFDLFVQSSDYEGTPNAVLEAMALETPLVATDVGGTRELVRHEIDGLLIRPGNPAALMQAIARVLADPGAAAGRTQAARRRVEADLSFATRMASVEAIYQELAGPGRENTGAAVLPARV